MRALKTLAVKVCVQFTIIVLSVWIWNSSSVKNTVHGLPEVAMRDLARLEQIKSMHRADVENAKDAGIWQPLE